MRRGWEEGVGWGGVGVVAAFQGLKENQTEDGSCPENARLFSSAFFIWLICKRHL